MKLGLLAVENNTCRIECHHHGHRVKDCPKKAKSGSAEHPLEECPKGGKSFSGGTERSSAEAPSVIPPGGPVLLLRQQLRQVVAVAVLVMLVS